MLLLTTLFIADALEKHVYMYLYLLSLLHEVQGGINHSVPIKGAVFIQEKGLYTCLDNWCFNYRSCPQFRYNVCLFKGVELYSMHFACLVDKVLTT